MVPRSLALIGALLIACLPAILSFCPSPSRTKGPGLASSNTLLHSSLHSRRSIWPSTTRRGGPLKGLLDDDEEEYQRRLAYRQEQERLEELEEGPPPYQMKTQFSVFDDLGPFLLDYVRAITTLDKPGTRRRAAQTTILSVSLLSLALGSLTLALVPLGFIHRADTTTAAQVKQQQQTTTKSNMMVVKTKTFVDPDKILEEDFIRSGGVYADDFPSTWSRTPSQPVDDEPFDIDI